MDNQQNFNYQYTPAVKNAAYYRARARGALKGFFGYALVAFLIASLLGGVVGGGASFGGVSMPTTDTSTVPDEFADEVNEFVDVIRTGDLGTIFSAYPFLLGIAVGLGLAMLLGMAFTLFVSSPVTVGYQRYNLNLMDGKDQTDMTVLFRYFKVSYLKTVGLRVVYTLISFAVGIPALVAAAAGFWFNRGAFIGLLTGDASEHHLVGVGMAILIMLAGSVVSTVLSIAVMYRFAFCFMIMAEYPEIGVVGALRNSWNLMRGNVWKLFCLRLSFIGWMILGILACCGIGTILVMPYMQAADAAFYDDIANRAAARETEFPSIDPTDYFIN